MESWELMIGLALALGVGMGPVFLAMAPRKGGLIHVHHGRKSPHCPPPDPPLWMLVVWGLILVAVVVAAAAKVGGVP